MRYKVIGYIEADISSDWTAVEIREVLDESLSHYGDVSSNFFVNEEPLDCDVHPLSSRGCERGTRGCEIQHKDAEE